MSGVSSSASWPKLTGILAEIETEIDLPTALAIARLYGGQRLHIPKRIEPDHKLAIELGLGPARILSSLYAPDRLEVPHGPYSGQGGKRRAIEAMLADGISSTAEIARATGSTERWVREVKNDPHGIDPNQLGLFDQDEAA